GPTDIVSVGPFCVLAFSSLVIVESAKSVIETVSMEAAPLVIITNQSRSAIILVAQLPIAIHTPNPFQHHPFPLTFSAFFPSVLSVIPASLGECVIRNPSAKNEGTHKSQ